MERRDADLRRQVMYANEIIMEEEKRSACVTCIFVISCQYSEWNGISSFSNSFIFLWHTTSGLN